LQRLCPWHLSGSTRSRIFPAIATSLDTATPNPQAMLSRPGLGTIAVARLICAVWFLREI